MTDTKNKCEVCESTLLLRRYNIGIGNGVVESLVLCKTCVVEHIEQLLLGDSLRSDSHVPRPIMIYGAPL